jgi:nucleoside phosphorylase
VKVDVAILTALPEERDAVLVEFERATPVSNGHPFVRSSHRGFGTREYVIFTRRTEEGYLRIAIPMPLGMGQLAAAIGTSEMLLDIAPTITILAGIAGCMHSDHDRYRLGDVAVSNQIHDYELCKMQDGRETPRWVNYRSDDLLTRHVNDAIRDETWSQPLRDSRPDRLNRFPKAHIGNVLSGNSVLADETRKKDLASKANAPVIAVEMEAAGVAAVLSRHHPFNRFLMIKAFSDYAGSDKADDVYSKDLWREYACRAAAALCVHLLSTKVPTYVKGLTSTVDPYDFFEHNAQAALRCLIATTISCPEFISKTAETVFNNAIAEVKQIVKLASKPQERQHWDRENLYKASVGAGGNFLLRAEPLFRAASRIYAVSLGWVSRFWVDPNAVDHVKAYIKSHSHGHVPSEGVIRLFVSETPEEAHSYARRFDMHAERFPNTFVCSREHYRMLLSNWLSPSTVDIDQLMRGDYAVLTYRTSDGDESDEQFFAELDSEFLRLSPAQPDRVGTISCAGLMRLFDDIARSTPPGELFRDVPVLKWKIGLHTDKGLWANILEKMFERRTADMFHFVGLGAADGDVVAEFRKTIARMKYEMLNQSLSRVALAKRYRIKGIRVTSAVEYRDNCPRDEVTGGRLRYISDVLSQHMVITRVADNDSLQGFLRDAEHTTIRLDLFKQLAKVNATIRELLETHQIDSVSDLRRLGDDGGKIYEQLEEAAGLVRFDLRDDEMIRELVEAEPLAM